MEDKTTRLAELIVQRKPTVALTGAGISVPSGIPDFRSPGTGLWDKIDPMEVASIHGFEKNPAKFFQFMAPLESLVESGRPNPAHDAVAELENMGLLRSIITQNIDNLHQDAGSKNVIELHGNASRGTCRGCGGKFKRAELAGLADGSGVPRCPRCGGVIKPDVVLFGESLPFDALMTAQRDAGECGVMLVVGSSLTVAPASMMPQVAYRAGAAVAVINLQSTYMDSYAEVALHEKVEEALPAVVAKVKELI